MVSANKAAVINRLRRLEARLLPLPLVPTAILHKPAADAPADECEAFERDLAAARLARAKVWIVTGEPVVDMAPVAGVTLVTSLWEAQLGVLAHQPSTEGRPSALDDLLARLTNNDSVIRPARGAGLPDDDDDEDAMAARL